MKKEVKGIVHNAFYKRNKHGDTKSTFLGRSKSSNMEPFLYEEDKDGKIVIVGTKK